MRVLLMAALISAGILGVLILGCILPATSRLEKTLRQLCDEVEM